MTQATAVGSAPASGAPGSQTLDRGLLLLEAIAQAEEPLTLPELCRRLELHRSIVYRLLRTLEDHGLAVRDGAGAVRLGLGVAELARAVERDLQAEALPELTGLAEQLGVTAFLAVPEEDFVVTLVSVQPRHARGAVAQRPGSRHPLAVGAPGAAIRSLLDPAELARLGLGEEALRSTAAGSAYAVSRDEVVPGLTAVAVPLALRGRGPVALSVVKVDGGPALDVVADALAAAAARIAESV